MHRDRAPAEGPAAERPAGPAAATDSCQPVRLPAAGRSRSGRSAGEGRAGASLFSPTILGLAMVAAAVWTAAYRNERLRALEQRPPRMAMEPPITAGPDRSLTP